MTRFDGRQQDELRPITFERDFTEMAAGSVLVSFGKTRVLCTASVDEDVPRWMKGSGKGWVTAEYSMLPGSSPERVDRLIGRALRSSCDMKALGERQILLDCDVLQADGGTRTSSICGAYIALHDALTRLVQQGSIPANPLHSLCAAISVGIHNGAPILDLPYEEDSKAEVDMNVVMLKPMAGGESTFVEVQGTAEGKAFSRGELDHLLGLASGGIDRIFAMQQSVLATPPVPRPIGR
jgi:ribonuclease PH